MRQGWRIEDRGWTTLGYDIHLPSSWNDTEARDIILSELDNSDREIREGALEAAIQFSDRSVIPRLREAADRTSDATEKEAILAAIDYLNLPSLTEYLEQAQTLGLTNGIKRTGFRPAPSIS
jgi:hypothetical protein